jgi:hypothetical protein
MPTQNKTDAESHVNTPLGECDKFDDHRRKICRGERPDLSVQVINNYRAHWGLEPLSVPSQPNIISNVYLKRQAANRDPEPILCRYPGTNLALLLKKCGVAVNTGCGCEEWIGKMNSWGVDGCYEHRQEIVDRLSEQARKLSTSQMVWTGILMMWHGIRPTIGELVDEAIWSASNVIANEK